MDCAMDWIKMRTDLYRDPKVCIMADVLMDKGGDLASFINQLMQSEMSVTRNVMRNAVVGALVTVWGVARLRGKQFGDDIVVRGSSKSVVDDITEMPGFGEAMSIVGWVIEQEGDLIFPRFFEDYNVSPSEKNAERQRRFREKRNAQSNAQSNDSNVTRNGYGNDREEKRREEKSEENLDEVKKKVFVVPTVDQVRDYCNSRENSIDPEAFVAFYESKGWIVGKSKMKNWKAAVVTWEKNERKFSGQPEQKVKQTVFTPFELAHGIYDPNGAPFKYNARLCRDLTCEACKPKRGQQT